MSYKAKRSGKFTYSNSEDIIGDVSSVDTRKRVHPETAAVAVAVNNDDEFITETSVVQEVTLPQTGISQRVPVVSVAKHTEGKSEQKNSNKVNGSNNNSNKRYRYGTTEMKTIDSALNCLKGDGLTANSAVKILGDVLEHVPHRTTLWRYKHKSTAPPVDKRTSNTDKRYANSEFEQAVLQKILCAEDIVYTYTAVQWAGEYVKKNDERFKDNQKVQSLKFSFKWVNGFLNRNVYKGNKNNVHVDAQGEVATDTTTSGTSLDEEEATPISKQLAETDDDTTASENVNALLAQVYQTPILEDEDINLMSGKQLKKELALRKIPTGSNTHRILLSATLKEYEHARRSEDNLDLHTNSIILGTSIPSTSLTSSSTTTTTITSAANTINSTLVNAASASASIPVTNTSTSTSTTSSSTTSSVPPAKRRGRHSAAA